jgi:hypothetical protein
MIVTMKPGITPLCDRHHKPMELVQFGASNISMTLVVHKCMVPACTRVYQHSFGYHDITDVISFEDVFRRDCPEDEMSMYLAETRSDGAQLWCCGQMHCDYSEQANPHERFVVMVRPVEVQDERPADDRPFAYLEATGATIGTRWIGPCQPWPLTVSALSWFAQNQAQVAGIRNSVTRGIPARLGGEAAPLAVTEQQLRKAGMKRSLDTGINRAASA